MIIFIYFWLCQVFILTSLVAVSGLLIAVVSRFVEPWLQRAWAWIALGHVESSQTRDQTCVPHLQVGKSSLSTLNMPLHCFLAPIVSGEKSASSLIWIPCL